MAHSVSHDPPPPPQPPPPLFSFLKTIQCFAVIFNFGSKCGTKDRHWCEQNLVFKVWIRPPIFGLSVVNPPPPPPPPPPPVQRRLHEQAAGELITDAHAYLQLSGINIRFAIKRSTSCTFTFVSSSLKDKMHFTCRTRRLANVSGHFTTLGLRKIEFYG